MLIKYDKVDTLQEKNDFGIGKVDNVKMIIIQSYDCDSAALAYSDITIDENKQPAHYVVDANEVIKYAPSTTNLFEPSVKFTALGKKLLPFRKTTSLFNTPVINACTGIGAIINTLTAKESSVKVAEDEEYHSNYINIVEVCWGDKTQYQAVANRLVELLAQLIRVHGYTLDNIWRAGDIIDFGGSEPELDQCNPYQYTHLKDWHSLLDAVDYAVKNPNAAIKDNTYCFEPDDHKDVVRHCIDPGQDPEHSHSGHVHHWEADDRGITELKTSISTQQESIINEDFDNKTINGSSFQQSKFQPDVSQEFVQMESNYYEPIYPDLTCPPRGTTGLYNKGVNTTKQILDNLTLAEQKAIQKLQELEAKTEMSSESSASEEDSATAADAIRKHAKPVIGKIPNIFDPYPVDEKIAQLEHHAPIVTLEFDSAQSVQDNLAFYLINRSINTEKRLVQLENIMTSQMRMLNRLSSRIQINCQYYGGQSCHDKYVCIRCLADDLTNDAAIVSLDQCLNCSRYEPVIGQVYEIMDEGLNPGEANIYDDIQASYMTKTDFVEFTRIEEMNIEDDNPSIDITNTTTRDESDKDYNDLLAEANNFVMDWKRIPWEKQSPHINIYEYDWTKISLDKDRLLPENKYEDGWRAIQQMKFERPDYGINTLGDGINSSGYVYNSQNTVPLYYNANNYNMADNDIRIKIVEHAKAACELCKTVQRWQYTFGAKIKEENLLLTPAELVAKVLAGETVSNGGAPGAVHTDCSNFTHYIYYLASNGTLDIPGTTASLYHHSDFTVINEGKEVLEAIKDAIPGDLLLFRGVGSGHVVIYIGDDECCEAYGDSSDKTKEVSRNKLTNRKDFVGIYRHKSLSVPSLKSTQYIDINCTLSEYVNKYQINDYNNTLDGTDGSWTRDYNAIAEYVDPSTRMTDQLKCQFMYCKSPSPENYITVDGINRFFEKKHRKDSMPKAESFIQAGLESGLNPIFLIAHCAGETGWGTSGFMNGSYIGPSGKAVYNAYGYACYNNDGSRNAAKKLADEKGWYSKEEAVIGGAKEIANAYFGSTGEAKHGIRNTTYFMKWHMGSLIDGNPGSPGTMQYATDRRWADIRAKIIYECMSCLDGGVQVGMQNFTFLIPRFKTYNNNK